MKIPTFKVLSKLLELRFTNVDATKLDVKQMTTVYLEQFVSGKDSQTVKAGILEILGRLAQFFPEEITALDKQRNILYLLLEALNKQFKSTKPDLQIIAGALKGFNSFLEHFTPQFQNGTQKRRK